MPKQCTGGCFSDLPVRSSPIIFQTSATGRIRSNHHELSPEFSFYYSLIYLLLFLFPSFFYQLIASHDIIGLVEIIYAGDPYNIYYMFVDHESLLSINYYIVYNHWVTDCSIAVSAKLLVITIFINNHYYVSHSLVIIRTIWSSYQRKYHIPIITMHHHYISLYIYTLQYTDIAVEHGRFIDDLPIENGAFL